MCSLLQHTTTFTRVPPENSSCYHQWCHVLSYPDGKPDTFQSPFVVVFCYFALFFKIPTKNFTGGKILKLIFDTYIRSKLNTKGRISVNFRMKME